MTMIDTIGTISQIRATLNQLSTGTPATPRTVAPAVPTKTSEAFAQAFSAAGSAGAGAALTVGSTGLAPAPATGAATGQGIADDARRYLGVPYVWGGTNPATGLDCSGLVQRVYNDMGITLPRVAVDQGNAGTTVPNLAAAKPGDLLVMNGGEHIGIYMGNNQYIHAPQPGMNVQIQAIPTGAVFDKITRIIPDAPAAGVPAETASTGVPDLLATLQASLATGRAA